MSETTVEEERIAKGLETLARGLPKLQGELAAIEITSEEHAVRLAEIITRATKARDLSKKLYSLQVSKIRKVLETFDGIWRPLVGGFDKVVKDGKAKYEEWVLIERAKRLKAEAEAAAKLREAQERQRAAEKAAADAMTSPEKFRAEVAAGRAFKEQQDIVAAMPVPVATTMVAGDMTISTQDDWDFVVLDVAAFAAAHPDCLEVKRAATLRVVRDAGKAGRPVPGLKIIPRARPVTR